MAEVFGNSCRGTLSGALTAGATSLTLATGAATFPGTGTFRIRIDSELMAVTGVAGSVFTVTRGIEGTTAVSHSDGSLVKAVLTDAGLRAGMDERVAAEAAIRAAADVILHAGYKALFQTSSMVGANASGKYFFGPDGPRTTAAALQPIWTFQWTNSLFAVSGKAVKWRLLAHSFTNAVGSGGLHTFSAVPISPAGGGVNVFAFTGGADAITATLTPAAGTSSYYGDSGDVTAPADGEYGIAVNLGSTTAASSFELVTTQLYYKAV